MSKINKKVKVRKVWEINPATRVKKNAKIYKRQKFKKEVKKYLEDLDDDVKKT